MAAPSVTGGITVLETCDTGSSGKVPIAPLASSTPIVATARGSGFQTGINSTGAGTYDPSSSPSSGALMGGIYALSGSVDLSVANRLAFFHYFNTDRVTDIAVGTGLMLYVNSGSLGTEEAAFAVNGGNNPISAYDCAVVNLNRSADAHIYSGSFDPSDITHMGSAANFDIGFSLVSIETFGYVDPIIVINGETANKGDFEDVTAHIDTNDTLLNESPTDNMHHCFFAWGAGNGSTASEFSEILKVFEFAKQVDFSTNYGRAHINDNDIGFELNASSSDVHDFELCTWLGVNPFYWNSIGSTSATVSYVSCVIQNAGDLTIVNGHTFSGCTFDSCAKIVAQSPTFTNTAIKNSATTALELTDTGGANLTNVTFSGNQTAIIVDTAGNAAIDVTGCTFDNDNTFFIEYTGTGTLTVTATGSIDSGKLNESGGGTITVVAPTTTFTINASESSSLIQIFTTATQTILASTTGSSLAHDFSGTVVVDYVVQKAGFILQRFVGVTLTDSSTTVNQPASREYDASHGKTYTTDASWNRSLNQVTVPTFGVTGQEVFSLLLDAFIAETSLRNTAFNIEMDGTGSVFLTNGAEGNADSSIENLIECGCAYLTAAGVTTASWVGVKSVGTATGFTGEYQQIDGTTTTDARASGIFNELLKMFGDVTHGNFDFTGHLVLKFQPNTYREARSDVLSDYGITTLDPTLYIVAMEPVAIGITAGDPAISITIVDHTSVPLVVAGKSFDYEIQDNGANDGEAMLREINYNLSLDATYNGKDPFNWPEMILKAGSTFETIQGPVEGVSGTHGIYISRSAADHPDFTRHQSNDGTYYVKPITANASISNIVSGSRLRIFNETTATETFNGTPGTSFSDSYTEGTTYTSGDVVTIAITQTSGVTGQLPFTSTVVSSSSGWTILAAQESDDVYDGYGLNGSTITKFTADYVNDEVDLTIASNFSAQELYAWWSFNLTTSQGISDFFGGLTAQDSANLLINNSIVNIFLDNTTTTNVYQTDNIRIYRADEVYPVKNPTSGGGGIDVVWRDRVFLAVSGSGVTNQDKLDIKDLVFDEVIEGSETFKQQTRLIRAEAAGKLAVAGTTVTIRDAADTKDRITATVDTNGQRTAITTDVS